MFKMWKGRKQKKEGCNFRKGGMKDGMDNSVCIYVHM